MLADERIHILGKMIDEAHPYPQKKEKKQPDYLFPYEAIKHGSKVVIYGAGRVGRAIVQWLEKNHYCSSILWIDQHFDNKHIMSPNCLLNLPPNWYDCIILATSNPFFEVEMKSNLKDMGISNGYIFSCHYKNRAVPI